MARGGGLNLIGAICSQATLLVITIVLARVLGGHAVGRYAQCYAFLSLLGLLALSGFRAGLTRFVAIHLADRDPGLVRGTVRLGLALSLAASTLIAVALAGAAPQIASAMHDPGLTTGLRLVGLALPAETVSAAALAATQGWRTQRPFAIVGQIYEPLCRLAITALALALGAGLTGAFWALVVAAWSTGLLAYRSLHRLLRTLPRATPRYAPRALFAFSSVSWVSSLSTTGLIWADTILLGLFGNEQIGIYNVSTRLVTVAIFMMAPINASFGPHIAHLYHRGQHDDLSSTYRAATGWITRLSLPAFVALLVFPHDLLRLFGHGFAGGATVTLVLAIGQLVNAATGPVGTVLNMSGRVWVNMVDNVGTLVLNVGLNIWLIPTHGIIGAAVAWSISLAVVNLTRVIQVGWLMRIVPFGATTYKGLAAGLAAGAAGVLIRWTISPWTVEIALGLVAIVAVYVASAVGLGLSAEDRMVLRSVTRRPRQYHPAST